MDKKVHFHFCLAAYPCVARQEAEIKVTLFYFSLTSPPTHGLTQLTKEWQLCSYHHKLQRLNLTSLSYLRHLFRPHPGCVGNVPMVLAGWCSLAK